MTYYSSLLELHTVGLEVEQLSSGDALAPHQVHISTQHYYIFDFFGGGIRAVPAYPLVHTQHLELKFAPSTGRSHIRYRSSATAR